MWFLAHLSYSPLSGSYAMSFLPLRLSPSVGIIHGDKARFPMVSFPLQAVGTYRSVLSVPSKLESFRSAIFQHREGYETGVQWRGRLGGDQSSFTLPCPVNLEGVSMASKETLPVHVKESAAMVWPSHFMDTNEEDCSDNRWIPPWSVSSSKDYRFLSHAFGVYAKLLVVVSMPGHFAKIQLLSFLQGDPCHCLLIELCLLRVYKYVVCFEQGLLRSLVSEFSTILVNDLSVGFKSLIKLFNFLQGATYVVASHIVFSVLCSVVVCCLCTSNGMASLFRESTVKAYFEPFLYGSVSGMEAIAPRPPPAPNLAMEDTSSMDAKLDSIYPKPLPPPAPNIFLEDYQMLTSDLAFTKKQVSVNSKACCLDHQNLVVETAARKRC